jgi:hypothetical protein
VIFTDATGRPLAAHAMPTPPTGPPPSPQSGYEHPTGERLNPMWTGLGWVHPNVLERRRQRANDVAPSRARTDISHVDSAA